MKPFEIYFNDLNEDAQDRLLKTVGCEAASEMNWDMDIVPLFVLELYDEEELNAEDIEAEGE